MPSFVTPKKNVAFEFYISLVSQADTKLMQVSPTLAAGDVKVSTDNGTSSNITTLPVIGTNTRLVKVNLSAAEMNGDNVSVVFSDAAGAQWCDVTINIQTSARQIDDLAFPATSGRSVVVDTAGLIDANMVKSGPTGAGTAQTARDLGASVLLSSGVGTGQLDFTAGVVKANLAQILGTALTETAGLIAAAFKKFFNVATPTGTVNSIPDAIAGAGGGIAIVGSNVGVATSVSGAVGSVTAAVTVGTNNDKTGYGLAVDALDAAALKLDAGQEIADRVLARSIAGGADGGRSVTSALRRIRNRVAIAAGTMTVYQENDTTVDFTGAVTTAAGNPISEIDPV